MSTAAAQETILLAPDALVIAGLPGAIRGVTLSGPRVAGLTPAERAYLVDGVREGLTAINERHAVSHPRWQGRPI